MLAICPRCQHHSINVGGARITEGKKEGQRVFRATYRLYYCEFIGRGCFSENRIISYESGDGNGQWKRVSNGDVPKDVVAFFEKLLGINKAKEPALA